MIAKITTWNSNFPFEYNTCMIVNSNGQVMLNQISYINNQDVAPIYYDVIATQALMDSDDADSNSMIDLISDLDVLVNAVGGTYDIAKFAATVMRVPTEIGTEALDVALNPAITAAGKSANWATVTGAAASGKVKSFSGRIQSYWAYQAQNAAAQKMGFRSGWEFNKAGQGMTATQLVKNMTGYAPKGSSYRSAMALKNATNIIKYGKTGANLIKGIPWLGTGIDIGMIGATWNHSDKIAKGGGITGALMGIGGVIAAPFTFGGSLALSVGGAAIGAGTSFA